MINRLVFLYVVQISSSDHVCSVCFRLRKIDTRNMGCFDALRFFVWSHSGHASVQQQERRPATIDSSTESIPTSKEPRILIKAIDLGEDEVGDKTIEGGKLHQIRSQSSVKHGRELSYSSSPVVEELWNLLENDSLI